MIGSFKNILTKHLAKSGDMHGIQALDSVEKINVIHAEIAVSVVDGVANVYVFDDDRKNDYVIEGNGRRGKSVDPLKAL